MVLDEVLKFTYAICPTSKRYYGYRNLENHIKSIHTTNEFAVLKSNKYKSSRPVQPSSFHPKNGKL